jgi:teichoic acid transport system permease protein
MQCSFRRATPGRCATRSANCATTTLDANALVAPRARPQNVSGRGITKSGAFSTHWMLPPIAIEQHVASLDAPPRHSGPLMAANALRTPTVHEPTVTGIPPLGPYVRGIWARRPLMWHIARTDLKSEHYDTVLGQFWVILDPLLLASVFYVVRTVIRPIGGGGPDRNELLAHLVWAIFFFTFASRGLTKGSRSITANKGLILNSAFPRAVFPIVAVIESLLTLLPTLAVYLVLHAILGQPFGLPLIMLPVMIALLTLFTFGIGLFFAPLIVFFRDTSGFMPYATRVWLYLTPVLFATTEIPANVAFFFRLNPLYPFFAALEQIFNAQWPSPVHIVWAAAVAVSAFVAGALVFLVRERDFATRF